ncbi:MAG: hypothetical protein ACRDBY_06000 [Cetobacterium sp.]
MESTNYNFWKMAFDKKIADVNSVAKAALSKQITVDEFQTITGLSYIPYIANGTENFISTKDIMADLANTKLDNMNKSKLIDSLTKETALSKINAMKKESVINDLTSQVANNKLEIMIMNNKTVKEGN